MFSTSCIKIFEILSVCFALEYIGIRNVYLPAGSAKKDWILPKYLKTYYMIQTYIQW